MKLTPAQRRALTWMREHEPVSSFPLNGIAPDLRFVRRLEKLGFVDRVGKEHGVGLGAFGFTKFGLTDLGRAALSQSPDNGAPRHE